MPKRIIMTGDNKPDANTLLLLHFVASYNGECGNTVIPHNVTLTSEGKFKGGGSFDDNSYLAFSNNAEIYKVLETGIFTLECWVKPNAISQSGIIFSVWKLVGNDGYFLAGPTTWLNWGDYMYLNASPYYSGSFSLVAGQFNPFAIIGDGYSTKYYTNGILRINAPKMGVDNFKSEPFLLGKRDGSFKGIISEFRVSNVARWTSNFTPPTKPY